ncbi:MAG: DUF4301 family protein, partial [Bacteroidota bacterium]
MSVDQSIFTQEDLAQIEARGSKPSLVATQLQNFQQGFPFLEVIKAATVGDGMLKLEDQEIQATLTTYQTKLPQLKVVKFVPASGAASRMFKDLFAFMEEFDGTQAPEGKMEEFFTRLPDFAFYADLDATFEGQLAEKVEEKAYGKILTHLLTEAG